MKRRAIPILAIGFTLLVGSGCNSKSGSQPRPEGTVPAGNVDETRLAQADQEPGNWMSYGRTYSEQRFSPLKLIDDQSVGRLGLAWYVDIDTRRGQEATPIVVAVRASPCFLKIAVETAIGFAGVFRSQL